MVYILAVCFLNPYMVKSQTKNNERSSALQNYFNVSLKSQKKQTKKW